jgi:hypothetical protein
MKYLLRYLETKTINIKKFYFENVRYIDTGFIEYRHKRKKVVCEARGIETI